MKWVVTVVAAAAALLAISTEWSQVQTWRLRKRADNSYYDGDFKKTLARYELVIERRPDQPRSYTDPADTISQYLAGADGSLPAEEAERLAVSGVRYYLRAVDAGPPSAWSFARIASIAESVGAIRSRERGIDLARLSGDVASLDPEDRLAEAAWVRTIQIEPRNFYYRDQAGDFYLRRGFLDRALAHFRYSVRLHPILEKHYFLSEYSEASPDVLGAVEQGVRDALAAADTDVSAYNIHRLLADLYVRLGRFDDAQASFEAAAEVAPLPHTVDVQLGQVFASRGDDEAALKAFRRATEREPGYHRGWLHLALTLSRLGRHEEAVEAAYRARGLKPGDFATTAAVARVLEAAGMLDEAADILEHAMRGDPDRQQTYLQLIRIYESQGHIADATRVARELAKRFPDNPLFREQLEQLERDREGR